jgi:hypothetical protein
MPFFTSPDSIPEMIICVSRDPGDTTRLLDYSV